MSPLPENNNMNNNNNMEKWAISIMNHYRGYYYCFIKVIVIVLISNYKSNV